MEPSGILLYETNIFQFEVKKYACYTGVPSERREVPEFERLRADFAAQP